jgi:hypothetical protein
MWLGILRSGVINIDLIARERGRREQPPVRTILQLIRVAHRYPPLQRAGARIEKEQRVAGRVANHQRTAIRAQHQMMRLAQQRNCLHHLMACQVDDTDVRVVGIDHENAGCGCRDWRAQQSQGDHTRPKKLHRAPSHCVVRCVLPPPRVVQVGRALTSTRQRKA